LTLVTADLKVRTTAAFAAADLKVRTTVALAAADLKVRATAAVVHAFRPALVRTQPALVRTQPGLVRTQPGLARTQPGLARTQAIDATRPSFADWLAGVRAEALARGIRPEIVEEALGHLEEPLPVVIERDRAQAEAVLPLEKYIDRRLTKAVVKTAREKFARHRSLLDEVAWRYGVSPRIIVAVWGLESNFGRFSGVRPTIAALATLAWDPRRSTFFRGELFDALEILNRGDIDLARMRGSWAGAMGQLQFMPSSYLKFAEDFDGDGRRDIWSTPADIFASIANYLKGHGWIEGEAWGRPVKVSSDAAGKIAARVGRRAGSCQATRDMTVMLPVKEWRELGVRLPSGAPLPAATPDAALVSGTTKHFLVYNNYDALLDYNCAHSYAVSVGLLADRIGSGSAPPSRPARKRAP
jgi:membrane-bound lytic murein transglycosylase B